MASQGTTYNLENEAYTLKALETKMMEKALRLMNLNVKLNTNESVESNLGVVKDALLSLVNQNQPKEQLYNELYDFMENVEYGLSQEDLIVTATEVLLTLEFMLDSGLVEYRIDEEYDNSIFNYTQEDLTTFKRRYPNDLVDSFISNWMLHSYSKDTKYHILKLEHRSEQLDRPYIVPLKRILD